MNDVGGFSENPQPAKVNVFFLSLDYTYVKRPASSPSLIMQTRQDTRFSPTSQAGIFLALDRLFVFCLGSDQELTTIYRSFAPILHVYLYIKSIQTSHLSPLPPFLSLP